MDMTFTFHDCPNISPASDVNETVFLNNFQSRDFELALTIMLVGTTHHTHASYCSHLPLNVCQMRHYISLPWDPMVQSTMKYNRVTITRTTLDTGVAVFW